MQSCARHAIFCMSEKISSDILSALSASKKVELLQLIHRFRSQSIQVHEFLVSCRLIVGPRLYAQLSANLNDINAAAPRRPNAAAIDLMGPGISALADALSVSSSSAGPSFKIPDVPKTGTAETSRTSQGDGAGRSSRMDTDALQDILACSGVDLKEEAETILKEQDTLLAHISTQMATGDDPRSRAALLFNVDSLTYLVSTIATKYRLANCKSVDPVVFDALLFVLQGLVARLIDDMVLLSRHRVDSMRSQFKTRIENDPRRQLFVLERALEVQREQDVDAFNLAAGNVIAAKKSRTNESEDGSISVAGSTATMSLMHEEAALKTRITNETALGQLGIPLKRWMVPTSSSPRPFSSGPPGFDKDTLPRSSLMPERKIIVRDFVCAVSFDPVLCRSFTLVKAYLFMHSST